MPSLFHSSSIAARRLPASLSLKTSNRLRSMIFSTDCSIPFSLVLMDAEPPNLAISETVNKMVVDHTDGLHVRVDHSGSDEAESPPLEIATERIGLASRRGDLPHGFPTILARPAVDEL